MKLFLAIVGISVFSLSCNNDTKSTDSGKPDEKNLPAAVQVIDRVLGSFVGAFGDNKITLLIIRARPDSVVGRSIVGGNDRPFFGTLKEVNGKYEIVAREPGDDPNDGEFKFTIDGKNPDIVTGSWKPFDEKKPAKDYTLQRKEYKYRIDVGDFPEASQRLLKPEDVENLMKEELEFMRNEIFARHGYCFKKKHHRQEFEMQDWYVPDNVDVRDRLTEIEKKNLELIKRYEKYAEEFGDEYGR